MNGSEANPLEIYLSRHGHAGLPGEGFWSRVHRAPFVEWSIW